MAESGCTRKRDASESRSHRQPRPRPGALCRCIRSENGSDDCWRQYNNTRGFYLVEHGSGGEGLDIFREGFDDRAQGIEEDGDDDQFNAPKHVCNLGCRGLNQQVSKSHSVSSVLYIDRAYLCGDTDDSAQNVDGREQAVLGITLGGIGLHENQC